MTNPRMETVTVPLDELPSWPVPAIGESVVYRDRLCIVHGRILRTEPDGSETRLVLLAYETPTWFGPEDVL